ncbi:putative Serine-type D-Ala-D-Ala carboxypeptidase [Tenacibaculum litopenaei]|uniref:serine hydrolase domain-containing protein n=1 Tax=Tenacibaculum litopenaei TaxID=396016 RepID=UPI003895B426
MNKIVLFFGVWIAASIGQLQAFQKDKLDAFFNELASSEKAMGTVSVRQAGNPVYQYSFGKARLQPPKEANKTTVYKIGSISKTYTAVLILQLVDQGKLTLEERLDRFFPSLPNASEIRLIDLLKHRSGLFDVLQGEGFHTWVRQRRTQEEMLTRIANHAVVFPPNTKTAYSNTNYLLLSYIAEKVSGLDFGTLLHRAIVKPLQLKKTGFAMKAFASQNSALPYYDGGSGWEAVPKTTCLANTMGAGGVVSTADEITHFYHHLLKGSLLSSKSLKAMLTPEEEMGMGVSVMNYKGLQVIGHDGAIDGYKAVVFSIPQLQITVAMTFNASNVQMTPTAIQVLEIFLSSQG